MGGMSRVLSSAIMLLTMMLLTCALFLTQALNSTYFKNISSNDLSDLDLEQYQQMHEYFGTFSRCLLSMFEVTLGNWPPVVRLLTEEVTEWFMVFGVLHKLAIGFAVIGVINGVIMQETFKAAATDNVIMVRQKKKAGQIGKAKMTALFHALDE